MFAEMTVRKKIIIFPLFFIPWLFPLASVAQATDSLTPETATASPPYSKTNTASATEKKYKVRRALVAGFNVAAYGSSLIILNNTWYKNFPRERLHSFNDSKEWLQMDKAGHVFSAYFEGKYCIELWNWAKMERKKAIWIGGLSGAAYQTVIEFLDGTSAKWGWSWADFGANLLGSGLLIGQELAWGEQRLQLKMGYNPEKYEPALNSRVNELFGKGGSERFLKDYNAQTYWLSANLRAFFPKTKLPRWLNIAAGYGATGMLGGFDNKWTDAGGNEINRSDIQRRRQWYLSPDIDLTRIKTNKVLVKYLLQFLNMWRIPLPTLEITGGKAKVKLLSF
ncbi:MAG: DUF2279 domain-containing protein [Dinghuibacter sp.]|nr:DUF2279 domain-containing protein [Dinghuibacter sp.]